MEKKDAILRINDWENRRKGLIYAGLVVGTIGLAAGLNLVGIIPTIPGTEESSKTVFETCLAAEIPILGIRQGIEANANIIRKIIGKDKKNRNISNENTDEDCAIYEINKSEEKRNGMLKSAALTGLIAGGAALGIFISNKENSSKILEYISKFKEEFQTVLITSIAAILLSLGGCISETLKIRLIKKNTGIDYDDVWKYKVKNGERGARVKTIGELIKSGVSKISGIAKK